MSGISAIAIMNIAGMEDETLAQLRKFFVQVSRFGTEDGRQSAPGYLEVIDAEIAARKERSSDAAATA